MAQAGRGRASSLAVTCELCHHEAVLPVDQWGDGVPVPAFGPRMVCTSCGIVGADVRPNWREMKASGNWRTGPALLDSQSGFGRAPRVAPEIWAGRTGIGKRIAVSHRLAGQLLITKTR